MRFKELSENTVAGSIASVAMPLGDTQKRNKPEKAPKVAKGKKYGNVISEGKMKELAYDLQHLNHGNFVKKYGKEKEYFRKKLGNEPVSEAELSEQDLIVVPGMRKSKDTSFIPHEKDRRDHEVEMARNELYAAAKDAMRVYKMLKNRTEDEGLMGWQQSYITLASDYLNSVADSLEHHPMKEGGGVIAGGMSNFEEGRYYNPLDQERREQDAMDQERRDFKRREMEYELRGEEEAARRANEGPWYIRIDGKLVRDKNKDPYVFNTLEAARKAAQTMMKKDWNKGKQFTMTRSITEGMSAAVKLQRAFDREKSKSDASRERGQEELDKARKEYDKKQGKCPECGGEMVSEELMNEKKDACYYKVKSRYKVWPSAYASGALVKCRKKGSKNWGNKSK